MPRSHNTLWFTLLSRSTHHNKATHRNRASRSSSSRSSLACFPPRRVIQLRLLFGHRWGYVRTSLRVAARPIQRMTRVTCYLCSAALEPITDERIRSWGGPAGDTPERSERGAPLTCTRSFIPFLINTARERCRVRTQGTP